MKKKNIDDQYKCAILISTLNDFLQIIISYRHTLLLAKLSLTFYFHITFIKKEKNKHFHREMLFSHDIRSKLY